MDRVEIEQAVDAGIKLLDEKGPSDWRQRIDIRILDIDDDELCVLAQVFGSFMYTENLNRLGLENDGRPYGFCAYRMDEWEPLTNEWKRRLAA